MHSEQSGWPLVVRGKPGETQRGRWGQVPTGGRLSSLAWGEVAGAGQKGFSQLLGLSSEHVAKESRPRA